ncbi:MAG: RHS repeat-associated core domain-containing protein [Nanoarchaeota archaeon]|nr:RHS repeat-associated core domain-containing protein [Nanoarchaeota archaeon]MBU1444712.1 RHS repeat-associated core domain-containing protein [Nanoarchaeota archaeon]MBU2406853.1 RHS repeat-associated core domain-containing protein [Nanoarchaeota archaeon]MBU2420564.1 RHS repeat-associated core domain-containing protein [Nanoarchaeota archaeon]MBU2475787.1 RHS repeat-associated core domain-containing protein [Nanoarchaeota archaeon]
MKKSVLFVILLSLFVSVVSAETLHPISKVEVKPTNIQQVDFEPTERIVSTATKTYYYGTGLVAKEENDELSYYHKDNLGSTVRVTDSVGNEIDSSTYLPYGENLESSDETFGFTGKEQDDSGLQYFNARYYDPFLGVFISVDPIGDGINWYQYTSSNPVNRIDPVGLDDGEVEFLNAPGDVTQVIENSEEPKETAVMVIFAMGKPERGSRVQSEVYNSPVQAVFPSWSLPPAIKPPTLNAKNYIRAIAAPDEFSEIVKEYSEKYVLEGIIFVAHGGENGRIGISSGDYAGVGDVNFDDIFSGPENSWEIVSSKEFVGHVQEVASHLDEGVIVLASCHGYQCFKQHEGEVNSALPIFYGSTEKIQLNENTPNFLVRSSYLEFFSAGFPVGWNRLQ